MIRPNTNPSKVQSGWGDPTFPLPYNHPDPPRPRAESPLPVVVVDWIGSWPLGTLFTLERNFNVSTTVGLPIPPGSRTSVFASIHQCTRTIIAGRRECVLLCWCWELLAVTCRRNATKMAALIDTNCRVMRTRRSSPTTHLSILKRFANEFLHWKPSLLERRCSTLHSIPGI